MNQNTELCMRSTLHFSIAFHFHKHPYSMAVKCVVMRYKRLFPVWLTSCNQTNGKIVFSFFFFVRTKSKSIYFESSLINSIQFWVYILIQCLLFSENINGVLMLAWSIRVKCSTCKSRKEINGKIERVKERHDTNKRQATG